MARTTDSDRAEEGFVDGYLAFLLAKASHLVSGGFHRQLKTMGISIATWRILAVLGDGARPVGELADRVLLNQPTLSKALDRLERDGLIKRSREAANRRSVTVSLLPRGRAMAARLLPMANAHEAEAFASLGASERRALVGMLQRTIAANARAL
jgi:DNA-binding MarR family transcriptional regulator